MLVARRILSPRSLRIASAQAAAKRATPALAAQCASFTARQRVAFPAPPPPPPPPPLAARTFVSSAARLERVKTGQPSEGERQIIDILTQRFKPKQIQVADISGGCGSFYAITLSSKDFNGLSTIKQHRLVNQELKDVISGIHGLQLRTQGEE
ncbi:hypothetical protein OC834_003182 [Tilletia horrida]|nr:hypothetical protein OC834_003182 [Tilletia horrida]